MPAESAAEAESGFRAVQFFAVGNRTAACVFAGYGATAEEFGYDDYAGIDVKDKIVVVLRYEPAVLPRKAEIKA